MKLVMPVIKIFNGKKVIQLILLRRMHLCISQMDLLIYELY